MTWIRGVPLGMMVDQKKIVIVEDEPDTAEMFAEMMRLSGYLVSKSYGGPSAFNSIFEEKPDLVLLDLMLPGLSGLDMLELIRKDPRLTHIPVIVISAKSLPSDVGAGLDAGASIYLTKPVAYRDLLTAVQNAIQLNEGRQDKT
jgi:DNA-binding response OmpR family regulator